MPPQDDPVTESHSLTSPVLAVGAFAAGAAATLVAKRLLDARRTAGDAADELPSGEGESKQDLANVLRRAALDVAVLATGHAADRLQSQDGAEPEPVSSESR